MNTPVRTPPAQFLPVINHTLAVYKLWQGYQTDFPKHLRYTLGGKIDQTFIEILENIFVASYQSINEKLPTIIIAIKKVDILKFFLQVSWELHALDNNKFILISEKVSELGRMTGGWKKGLESKTPQA